MAEREAVLQAQAERCEEQGHVWENGLTFLFRVVQICKYCGARRGV